MKLLNDHFKLYKDALFDDDVMKSFMSLVTKTKKFAKPELKQQIEEWESKLVEQSEMGLENKVAGDKAKEAIRKSSRRQAKNSMPKSVDNISSDEMNCDKENIELLNCS